MSSLIPPPGLPRRRIAVLSVAPLIVAALLTGCAGGGESTASKGAAGDRSAGDEAASAPQSGSASTRGGEDGGDGDASSSSSAARVLPGDRDIVYRGSITVRVRDVSVAAARAEALVQGVDGVVFAERTEGTAEGRGGQAQLTLRVPPSQFAATLDALGRLGRELDRSRSAQDVTTQLADTGSRVRSQQRSVERVRALLARADTIGEVVQVEAELARREADLESLQAQLARLEDVTALATIEAVFLARHTPEALPEDDADLGFLSGLRGGWEAMLAVLLVALTVLGAVLPFAVAAAVVGLPAYAFLRRNRRAAHQPTASG